MNKFLILIAGIFLLFIRVEAQNEIKGGILDKNVNGNDEDYNAWIIFGEKEDTLFFTSSREVPNRRPIALSAEMFFSVRPVEYRKTYKPINEGWSQAKQIKVDASRIAQFTRGSQAISGDRIIFAAEADMSTKTATGTSYLFDLWEMTKRVDGFSFPEPLKNVNDPDAWDSQPTLSVDGKVLVFVSNRKGGIGGLDLWYSIRDAAGTWSKPQLYPNINTPGDEVSPHFGSDGKFYFSSNWDYKTNKKGTTGKDIYRADFENKNGMQFPINPVLLDEALKNDAAIYGLTIPKDIQYNSSSDDEFPFVTPDRSSIFLTSNRKSSYKKRDIYAFSLPKSKIRLQVNVKEQILDSKGELLVPPTLKNGLSLILKDKNLNSNSNITSGEPYQVEADHDYEINFSKFVQEECYSNKIEGPEGLSIKTTRPFGMDTLFVREVLISRRKIEIPPIIFHSTDTLPYFITGYWYPNTSDNLSVYRKREESGFFNSTGFVDSTGHDYDGAARKIDKEFFNELYSPLIKLLPQFQEFCRDTLYLKVTVHGYTDPRGLSQGEEHPYRSASKNKRNYPDETITVGLDERGQQVTIPSGLDMWKQKWPRDPQNTKGNWISLQDEGQNGNILLSKLRAHFTFVTFDNEMTKLSPIYSEMRNQGRVILDDEGFGIDKEGLSERKLKDDPQSRRIEIYLDILRPEELKYHKRLPGGIIKEQKIPKQNVSVSSTNKEQPVKLNPEMDKFKVKDGSSEPIRLDDVKTINPNDAAPVRVVENITPEETTKILKPVEQKEEPIETPKVYRNNCYAIQYNTYSESSEAETALKILYENGVKEAKIIGYVDQFGNTNYRLKYGCFKTSEEAISEMKSQYQLFKKMGLTKKPVVVR